MCLLLLAQPGATPTRRQLENCVDANPHGFGWSLLTRDGLEVERTLDPKFAVDAFLYDRERNPDTFAMFHARWATHGARDLSNVHPFQVGGDPRTLLGHNGILPVEDLAKGDPRSDTRFFAERILPGLGGVTELDDPHVFAKVEAWARGSKLVVLTVDPLAARPYYILNEKAGHWLEGVWWSNDSYEDYVPSYKYAFSSTPSPADWAALFCSVCEEDVTEKDDWVCQLCGTCIWCDCWYKDCNCPADGPAEDELNCSFCGAFYWDCDCA